MTNQASLRRLHRLTHLQCATDGCWEKAIPLLPNEPLPSPRTIHAWVGNSVDFAIEMFFADTDDLPHFVGVRWNGKTAPQIADLVQKAHGTLQSVAAYPLNEVLTAFDAALDTSLLRSAPAFLEIGVNNLWKSVGSLLIWKRGQPIPTKSELDAKLRHHAPQLLLDQPNAIMLEVGHVDPQPHWLGLCASRRKGDKFQLDLDELLQFAQAFGEQ